MASEAPYIGTRISLISNALIRYEGILFSIDTKESTVTLADVQSFGTEDRKKDESERIPPRNEVYEFIVFRGRDIKDLTVCSGPKKQPHEDPAILQSGNMSMPRSYGQYPGPARPPYGTAGFGAFGGVPPYGGYPGFQAPRQPFPDRHPGMPPMMPPRIPTPPVNAPAGIQMHRSHTPSPETVMPIGVPPQAEQAAEGTAQTNSTIQQATQTTPQRKKAGRSSSRRSSEDKAAAQQDSRQEAGHEEKEGHEGNAQQRQQNENRNPRQGGGRRSRGRRGGGSGTGARGPRPGGGGSGPVKFEEDFDIESANAQFKKENIEEELQKKLGLTLRISDQPEDAAEGTEGETTDEVVAVSPSSYYDKSKSFFDSISCEANDREKSRRPHPSWHQERKMNAETFGASGRRGRGRGRFRGRGRGGGYGGRGYYRGGRGGRYRDDSQSSRDGSNDGEAGHGGRGRRGGRSRGSRGGRQARQWVDYPLDAEMERLQKNVQNGSNVASTTGDAAVAQA